MKIKLFTLILLVVTIVSCKKDAKKNLDVDSNTVETETKSTTANGEHCFTYVMKNSVQIDGEEFIEKNFVTVNLTIIDTVVKGEYKVTSSKRETNDSYFVGTLKDNLITCIQTYKRGEETLKDEMVFKIEANQISILGGEKILQEGVNMFVDKAKCDYMMQLPRVDCD